MCAARVVGGDGLSGCHETMVAEQAGGGAFL